MRASKENTVIWTRNLRKYYGRHRGIEDVTLEIRRGEIFGFLGPNGAGKTTTIRTLLDYIRPTGGEMTVMGADPREHGAEIRRKAGYLPSDFSMSSDMTAEEYLRFLLGMMEYRGDDRIHELSGRFDLDLGKRIKGLSRGNRQKVAIVSAFMHRPDLLILDEPTTGLDPLMQQEFYRLVLEERDKGNTVFLSSHILTEVDAVCDRVGIIRGGILVTVESLEEFKKKTGRIMRVTFEGDGNEEPFRALEGISEVRREDDELVLTVFSDIDGVIKELAKHTIRDLSYKETSLEHVFLRYYGITEVDRDRRTSGKGAEPDDRSVDEGVDGGVYDGTYEGTYEKTYEGAYEGVEK